MIIISSRKNFEDPDRLSAQDEAAEVTIGSGGTLLNRQPLSPSQVTQAVAGKTVLVVVHGYNNNFSEALDAYHTIAGRVSSLPDSVRYDLVLGYVWPGSDWRVAFHPALLRSTTAGKRLVGWLPVLAGAASVDVMTHSLGTRVLLRGMSDALPVGSVPIRYHFATASAVDNESIHLKKTFYRATQATVATWVFHSKHDPVLKMFYQIGGADKALGLRGPQNPEAIVNHSPNVRVVDCQAHISKHGAYKTCDEFYQFLAGILTGSLPFSGQFFTL